MAPYFSRLKSLSKQENLLKKHMRLMRLKLGHLIPDFKPMYIFVNLNIHIFGAQFQNNQFRIL